MDCTDYNAAINYNEPINYNGVCTTPPPQNLAGGFVNHEYHRIKPRKKNDDLAIVIMALELTDDDY
jgi:hypothetical protein